MVEVLHNIKNTFARRASEEIFDYLAISKSAIKSKKYFLECLLNFRGGFLLRFKGTSPLQYFKFILNRLI